MRLFLSLSAVVLCTLLPNCIVDAKKKSSLTSSKTSKPTSSKASKSSLKDGTPKTSQADAEKVQSSGTSLYYKTRGSDYVTQWNELIQQQVISTALNSNFATRAFAAVHVAQWRAVEAVLSEYGKDWSSDVKSDAGLAGALQNAVASAGRTTLVGDPSVPIAGIFPGVAADLVERLYQAQITSTTSSKAKIAADPEAIQIGYEAAVAVLEDRATDGSTPPGYNVGQNLPGVWRNISSGTGVTPQWATLRPWALTSANQFRIGPQPALDSPLYLKSYLEVLAVGNTTSATRGQEGSDIADFWKGNIEIYFFDVLQQYVTKLSIAEAVRAYAAVAISTADARISAWDSKYFYLAWRPITAIPLGNSLGGPYIADPSWKSYIPTPNHPEYPSGHVVTGSAAIEVIGLIFGEKALPKNGNKKEISLGSYTLTTQTRTYSSLLAVDQENSESRIFGGVHYRHSQDVSFPLGYKVGDVAYDYVYGN